MYERSAISTSLLRGFDGLRIDLLDLGEVLILRVEAPVEAEELKVKQTHEPMRSATLVVAIR